MISESRVQVGAYALLSPVEAGRLDPSLPVLWTWGDEEIPPTGATVEGSDPSHPFNAVGFRDAEHYDYLPLGRVACAASEQDHVRLMPYLAADLVALFFGRYLPQDRPGRSGLMRWVPGPRVSVSLEPRQWPRTTEQKFFAGGWLSAWPLLKTGNYAAVELNYRAGGRWRRKVLGG